MPALTHHLQSWWQASPLAQLSMGLEKNWFLNGGGLLIKVESNCAYQMSYLGRSLKTGDYLIRVVHCTGLSVWRNSLIIHQRWLVTQASGSANPAQSHCFLCAWDPFSSLTFILTLVCTGSWGGTVLYASPNPLPQCRASPKEIPLTSADQCHKTMLFGPHEPGLFSIQICNQWEEHLVCHSNFFSRLCV